MQGSVLVVGASGTQGGLVARKLLELGWSVTAASRSADRVASLTAIGAEHRSLDLRDPATVKAAVAQCEYAFFHAPMALGDTETERAALEAILQGGVQHLAYNVGFGMPREPVGVAQLDNRIRLVNDMLDTGRVSVLVPTGYLENFSAPWSAPRVLQGDLLYPLSPEVRVKWVTNLDVGSCVSAAFELEKKQWFRVAGPESLTLPEVAKRIGRGIGREVTFRQISGAEYAEILAPYVGEEAAKMVGEGYDQRAEEQNPLMTPDTTETESALGVHFTDVETWARTIAWEG